VELFILNSRFSIFANPTGVSIKFDNVSEEPAPEKEAKSKSKSLKASKMEIIFEISPVLPFQLSGLIETAKLLGITLISSCK